MNDAPISRLSVPALETLPDDLQARLARYLEKPGFIKVGRKTHRL